MKKKFLAGLATGFLMLGMVGIASANLITNGSFERDELQTPSFWTLGVGDTSLPGWSITGGTVDWIDGLWQPSNGDKSLDMNGVSAGTIVSDPFATISGVKYNVTFDMAGNLGGGTTVKHLNSLSIGDTEHTFTFDTTGHSFTDMGWEQMAYSFIATGRTSQLQFSGIVSDGQYFGAALDNVIVERANPVPEPATMLLFGTGLVGLVGTKLRRKKKQ